MCGGYVRLLHHFQHASIAKQSPDHHQHTLSTPPHHAKHTSTSGLCLCASFACSACNKLHTVLSLQKQMCACVPLSIKQTYEQMMLMAVKMAQQVAQTEGVGFYYSENIYGVPPVLIQHVQKFPMLHEVNILITNRAVPVPDVRHQERILVETLGLPGFYHCICR